MASGEGDRGYSPATWVMGIIAALIAVGAAWYLNANDRRSDRMADTLDRVLQVQSQSASSQARMQSDIEWIKRGISDIYTQSEAEQEHETIKRTTDDLYDKYRNLDARMSTVEKEQRK